jgi:hypothetical protein
MWIDAEALLQEECNVLLVGMMAWSDEQFERA